MHVLQSRASRSRCSIPGTLYGTCKNPTDYKSEAPGSASRVKTPCEQGLPHYTCYKQSNAFLMRRRRRRTTVSSWNVDPLRSTTVRGIRSARSGLGRRSFRSSALYRKSCHTSVSVMLEKRRACCRTDGSIRVPSFARWGTR